MQRNYKSISEEVLPEIERLRLDKKAMATEVSYLESKVTNLEANLPDMIKEIFEYFIQKKD